MASGLRRGFCHICEELLERIPLGLVLLAHRLLRHPPAPVIEPEPPYSTDVSSCDQSVAKKLLLKPASLHRSARIRFPCSNSSSFVARIPAQVSSATDCLSDAARTI